MSAAKIPCFLCILKPIESCFYGTRLWKIYCVHTRGYVYLNYYFSKMFLCCNLFLIFFGTFGITEYIYRLYCSDFNLDNILMQTCYLSLAIIITTIPFFFGIKDNIHKKQVYCFVEILNLICSINIYKNSQIKAMHKFKRKSKTLRVVFIYTNIILTLLLIWKSQSGNLSDILDISTVIVAFYLLFIFLLYCFLFSSVYFFFYKTIKKQLKSKYRRSYINYGDDDGESLQKYPLKMYTKLLLKLSFTTKKCTEEYVGGITLIIFGILQLYLVMICAKLFNFLLSVKTRNYSKELWKFLPGILGLLAPFYVKLLFLLKGSPQLVIFFINFYSHYFLKNIFR